MMEQQGGAMSLGSSDAHISQSRLSELDLIISQVFVVLEAVNNEISQVNDDVCDIQNLLTKSAKEIKKLQNDAQTVKENVGDEKSATKDKDEKVITRKMKALKKMFCQLKTGKQFQIYEERKDWHALKVSLEAVLDHSSEAYVQLQAIPTDSTSPFFSVGLYGYTELVEVLLSLGLEPDMTDQAGNTLLHGAAAGGHVKLAEFLLDQGVDCDKTGYYDNTPIICAAKENRLEMVKFLKECGADMNYSGENSWTCLHWAAYKNYDDMAHYLVEAGADTTAVDYKNRTPLYRAKKAQHEAMEKYLSQFPH